MIDLGTMVPAIVNAVSVECDKCDETTIKTIGVNLFPDMCDTDTLKQWAAMLGLSTSGISDQNSLRYFVNAALKRSSGCRPSDFVAMATPLGYTLTIQEGQALPFVVGLTRVGDTRRKVRDNITYGIFTVIFLYTPKTPEQDAALESVLLRAKPPGFSFLFNPLPEARPN